MNSISAANRQVVIPGDGPMKPFVPLMGWLAMMQLHRHARGQSSSSGETVQGTQLADDEANVRPSPLHHTPISKPTGMPPDHRPRRNTAG